MPDSTPTPHLLASSAGGRPGGWSLLAGAAVLGKVGGPEALVGWAAEVAAGPGAGGFQSMGGLGLDAALTDHLEGRERASNMLELLHSSQRQVSALRIYLKNERRLPQHHA